MNHYQVLGVESDADSAQIRKSYLKLARVNHPDFSEASGEQMRLINAAWHELSDPARRAEYDRQLRSHPDHGRSGVPTGASFSAASTARGKTSRVSRPSSAFTPYFANDEDDDDTWRYEPDPVNPETVPAKVMLAAPAAAFVAGIASLAVSAPTGIRAFVALGMILLILSGLLFVGAPVVALFKSQMAEQRSARRSTSPKARISPKSSRAKSPRSGRTRAAPSRGSRRHQSSGRY